MTPEEAQQLLDEAKARLAVTERRRKRVWVGYFVYVVALVFAVSMTVLDREHFWFWVAFLIGTMVGYFAWMIWYIRHK